MVEVLKRMNMEKNLYSSENTEWMESVSNSKTKEVMKDMAGESLKFLRNSLE